MASTYKTANQLILAQTIYHSDMNVWVNGNKLILVRLLKGERAVVSNGYKNWVVDWDEVDLTHYCYVCGEESDVSVCKRCEVKEMDNIYKLLL